MKLECGNDDNECECDCECEFGSPTRVDCRADEEKKEEEGGPNSSSFPALAAVATMGTCGLSRGSVLLGNNEEEEGDRDDDGGATGSRADR